MVSHQVSWFPSPPTEDDELFCGIVTFDLTSHWHPTLTYFPYISLKLGDKIWGRRPSYKARQVLDYVTVLEGEMVIHSLSLSRVTRYHAVVIYQTFPICFFLFFSFSGEGIFPTPTPKMSTTFKESCLKMSTPNNIMSTSHNLSWRWEWPGNETVVILSLLVSQLQPNEIIWVKHTKYPHWPALVSSTRYFYVVGYYQ